MNTAAEILGVLAIIGGFIMLSASVEVGCGLGASGAIVLAIAMHGGFS
jgi:hypothetical protein